jgi:hypothetical protein
MAIDWTKIYKQYRGLWVALKDDEQTVIASGKTAKEAWEKAREAGYEKPILTPMPATLDTYVGPQTAI